MELQEYLDKIHEQEDARQKLDLIEGAPAELRDTPELAAARLWWEARYRFTDRKRTMIQDKFVWLISFLSVVSRSKSHSKKEILSLYNDAILSSEVEAALASSDRLFDELHHATCIFVETLRQARPFMGLSIRRDKSKDDTFKRVTAELIRFDLVPVVEHYHDKPRVDTVLRAMVCGTQDTYPGIGPTLRLAIQNIPDAPVRDFLINTVGGDIQS